MIGKNKTSLAKQLKIIRNWRFILYDILGIAFTYGLAIMVLAYTKVASFNYVEAFVMLPFVIVFKLIVYYFFKFYNLVLDNVGLDEVFRITMGVLFSNILIVIITLAIPKFVFIPETYMIFTTVFEAMVIVFPRILKRLMNILFSKSLNLPGKRTLLVGAGAGGKLVLNELRNNPTLLNTIIGFVDDDDAKIGNLMSGYHIFGPIANIISLIDYYEIEEVIICIANIDSKRFQEIIDLVSKRPVTIKRLPKFKDIQKDYFAKPLVDVNVEDLLSRDVVNLDNKGIGEFISGKRVLITGAGGSIGSELVRQIIKHNPARVILFDIYENGIYDLQTELSHKYAKDKSLKKIETVIQIGSVYNYERLKSVYKEYLPEIIFHAAAYKHVPLMEGSSIEAVRTNILGTYNVCMLADEFKAEKMVLVSSDKAVRPTNVMGATKRFAETIIQKFNRSSKTNYSAVRFGNVLGSNGSVVPLFKKQIEDGGPITVTHKRIIRYFMTIPEAVSLILQSATYAKGGEIFILDMGDPVKIVDLAEKMIMLSGMKPYIDINIEFVGLRPGEKLYEELLVNKEQNIKTENEKIFIENIEAGEGNGWDIKDIADVFEKLNNDEIKDLIKKYVASYTIQK